MMDGAVDPVGDREAEEAAEDRVLVRVASLMLHAVSHFIQIVVSVPLLPRLRTEPRRLA